MNPLVGTLQFGDVYPGLATGDVPAPDRATTDQKDSATALEGVMPANMLRPSVWFVAFTILLLILYALHEV